MQQSDEERQRQRERKILENHLEDALRSAGGRRERGAIQEALRQCSRAITEATKCYLEDVEKAHEKFESNASTPQIGRVSVS